MANKLTQATLTMAVLITTLGLTKPVSAQLDFDSILSTEPTRVYAMSKNLDLYSPPLFDLYFAVKEGEFQERQKLLQMQLEIERREVNVAKAELVDLESLSQDAEAKAMEAGVTLEQLPDAIASLSDMARTIEIDLAGKRVREQAAKQSLAVAVEESSRRVDQDAVLLKLKELLAKKNEELARVMKLREQNVITDSKIAEAQAEVVEAEIRIFQREQELKNQEANPTITYLRAEIIELGLDVRELDSRLDKVKEELSRLRTLYEQNGKDQKTSKNAIEVARNRFLNAASNAEHAQHEAELAEIAYAQFVQARSNFNAAKEALKEKK